MGYDNTTEAVLIGAGKLGRALLGYSGFAEYGLEIVAAFDTNEAIDGEMESGKPIYAISRLPQFCKERKVLMGIITVPAAAAQEVCDLLHCQRHQSRLDLCPGPSGCAASHFGPV